MNTIKPEANRTSDTTYNPSPAIWEQVRMLEVLENQGKGIFFRLDPRHIPLPGTQTTEISPGPGLKWFNTGAGTISQVSAVNSVEILGGAIANTLDTANDSGAIAQAYPTFRMSGDKAVDGPLFFEACYAQNSIATNMAAGFIGLAEVELWTLATGVPFNGGDAITNGAAAIGFRIEEDGLGVVDTVYSDRATSFTNIGDTEAGTLAAYTFKKFGMIYDPNRSTDCIRFFADNRQLTTVVSKATLQALTNLDANALGFIWANCADSAGTSFAGYLKWAQVFQYYPDGYAG